MDTPLSFTAPEPSVLQEMLPAYEITQLIAQGGMGAVYRGKQRSLDREVAIKILPRELGADPTFHVSFETEARAMARLNHPNLISVYDFGDVDGMPYIVMEFVAGKSLYHSAYGMQVDAMESARITRDICDGLAHAHEAGIIHHDIKPANILLTAKVEPKIGDFGLAKPMDGGHAGLVMGTPGYAAPEVYSHPNQADPRSDIFAVGVILHELLTGKRPDEVNQPASQLCGCSPLFDQIIAKATHPDLSQRYQAVRDLERNLEDILAGRQLQGLLTPTTAKPTAVSAPAAKAPAPAAPAAAAPRGSREMRGPHAAGGRAPSAAQMVSSRRQGIPGPVWAAIGVVVLGGGGFAMWKYEQKRQGEQAEVIQKQKDDVAREAAEKQAKIDAQVADAKRMEVEIAEKKKRDIEEQTAAAIVRQEQASKEAAERQQKRSAEKKAEAEEVAKQEAAFKTKAMEIRSKGKEAVLKANTERDAALEANVKEYKGDLDSALNMIFRSERQPWEGPYRTLKGMTEGNRVPKMDTVTAAETNGDLKLSPGMRTILGNALNAEGKIDAAFSDKVRAIQSAVAKKLEEAMPEYPAAIDAVIAEKNAATGNEKSFLGYLDGKKPEDQEEEEEQ